MVKRIAIIPARGGSKRLPRKNILPFHGRPMLAWTIEAALQSGQFTRVLVSTEDDEIATVARTWGAEVPFLRLLHSDDQSAVSLATHTAFIQAEAYFQEHYEQVVQLMPCCPLRKSEHIVGALAQFEAEKRSFQISCTRLMGLQPWWMTTLDRVQRPEFVFPQYLQEGPPEAIPYFPSGAIWIAQAALFKVHATFYGPDFIFEPMPFMAALDIDTQADFDFLLSLGQSIPTHAAGQQLQE